MRKSSLSRFSISMDADLVGQLDAAAKSKGFANRSQAVADMVRHWLVEHHAELGDQEIAGTITLVYDHHKPNLQSLLTEIQHDCHGMIVSALHVHLDHHHCLEVLVVRGRGTELRGMADRLIAAKGVKHGRLTVTTTGKNYGK